MADRSARVILVLAMTLALLSITILHNTQTQADSLFYPFVIPPGQECSYSFTIPQEGGGVTQVMVLIDSNAVVNVTLVDVSDNQTVFSRITQGFYSVIPLPPGNYTLFITDVGYSTASGDLYIVFLPAPVGIADYGVKVVGNSVEPYVEKFTTVYGIAEIYSYSVPSLYNHSSSLQLNTVLHINTVWGPQDLWLQDVVDLCGDGNEMNYTFVDNIWNITTPDASVHESYVNGSGGFPIEWGLPPVTLYAYSTQTYSSELPLEIVLAINVKSEQGHAVVQFGYYNTTTHTFVWYDNVTVTVPGFESAYLLVDGYNATQNSNFSLGIINEEQSGHAYDTELVFGGLANGENVSFTSLNASLELLYYNGTFFHPEEVFPFGLDTAERAYNLETVPGNGAYEVTTGHGIELPLSLTLPLSLKIVNYTKVVYKGYKVVAEVSVSGGEAPYVLVVSFEGRNSTYLAYLPGTYRVTETANKTGMHELVITAYSFNGQRVSQVASVSVNSELIAVPASNPLTGAIALVALLVSALFGVIGRRRSPRIEPSVLAAVMGVFAYYYYLVGLSQSGLFFLVLTLLAYFLAFDSTAAVIGLGILAFLGFSVIITSHSVLSQLADFLTLYSSGFFLASLRRGVTGIGIVTALLIGLLALSYPVAAQAILLIALALSWRHVKKFVNHLDGFTAGTMITLISVPFLYAMSTSINFALGLPLLGYASSFALFLIAHVAGYKQYYRKVHKILLLVSGLLAYMSLLLALAVPPNVLEVSGSNYQLILGADVFLALFGLGPVLRLSSYRYSTLALGWTAVLLGIAAAVMLTVPREVWFAVYTPLLPLGIAAPYAYWKVYRAGYSGPIIQPLRHGPVRFIIRGVPPSAKAKVKVGNKLCEGNPEIKCDTFGIWVAYPVIVAGNVYEATNPGSSGYVSPGDVVTLQYTLVATLIRPQAPQSPQTPAKNTVVPSRPLTKVQVPQYFDPNYFIGKRLGVYQVESLIGTGGMGYVYLGTTGSGRYAIKLLKLERGNSRSYFEELFTEANNLVNLSNHPKVVKIYAVNVDLNVIQAAVGGDLSMYYVDPPRIVMEYMEGGSLDRYLYDDTYYYSSSWEAAVRNAVTSVAEALSYIHSKGYVHLDVKPQNIFLSTRPQSPSDILGTTFKLGDLGSAIRTGRPVQQLTIEYSPPEAYLDPATPTMDMFALGVTLYVLLTRKNDRPDLQAMNEAFDCYVNNDMDCVRTKVNEARSLLAAWDVNLPEPYRSVIKALTDPEPLKRPTSIDIMKMLRK